MNGLAASRPSATTVSVGACAPPAISSMTFSVASASTIMIATSSAVTDAARDDHVEHRALELLDGRERHPGARRSARRARRRRARRTAGPQIWVDADAALIASTSYRSLGSRLRMVTTTWISLRRPSTKDGRSGRSISRQVRIASVDGRPSRRKNEPGMRPAAYIRSSTSIVSGKKSKWSLGFLLAVVADSSMVSSSR